MDQKGFTLIELIIVIGIIGVLLTIVFTYSFDSRKKNELKAASRQVYSLLQGSRVDAMTASTATSSRGRGLVFAAHAVTQYEFIDLNGNYRLDSGERRNSITTTFPASITLSTVSTEFLYDSNGQYRDTNWGTPSGTTVRLSATGVAEVRCVVISEVMIREGKWNGSSCVDQ